MLFLLVIFERGIIMNDGIYVEVFAIQNGSRYNVKIVNIRDLSRMLTQGMLTGIDKLCKIEDKT